MVVLVNSRIPIASGIEPSLGPSNACGGSTAGGPAFTCHGWITGGEAAVTRLQRLRVLLGANILISGGLIPIANSAQSPLEKLPSIQNCLSGGHFESWSPSGQLILLNDNHFVECDLENGAAKPTDYLPPRPPTFEDLRANSQKPVNIFPDVIKYTTASTGEVVTWTHVAPLYFKYDANYLPVETNLLSSDQGELAIYTAPSVDDGKSTARFAVAFRKDAKYKMIEMEAQPHKHVFASGYPWGHLTSSVDYTTGRVLMFFDDEALYPDTKYIDGWSPFNVWWFDPQTAALTHLVLPDGPWVKDADKPRILGNIKSFPVGVGSTYEIKAAGGKIFVLIGGTLSESSLGMWMFNQSSNQWKKIANKGIDLKRISPDGCKLAVDHAPSVSVSNLCSQG